MRWMAFSLVALGLVVAPAHGQTLRERVIARMKEKSVAPEIDPGTIVAGATRTTLSYGADADQTVDVFAPPHPTGAPVIVMVHGGGWRLGDKTSRGVVENKLKHWLPKGFILVSVDYRLLPDASVEVQAEDVARATAFVEHHAADWGGDGKKIVLMGHSAGAHLVALLSSDPSRVVAQGGTPWAGTVVIDSAALDVAHIMTGRHARLYDDAFGTDPAYWAKVSPSQQLKSDAVPMLLICALKRPDDSCGQAHAFAAQSHSPVLGQDLTHMQVNDTLGLPGAYTDAVDAFVASRVP